MKTWIVGGGLLGSAVARTSPPGEVVTPDRAIPWDRPADVPAVMQAIATRFFADVGSGPWRVIWCAGPGIVGTTSDVLEREIVALASLLEAIAAAARDRGSFLLSSSAGAVYAGSNGAPFTETTECRPTSAYGHAKLRQEAMVETWAHRTGNRVAIARIANLYGPGQRLDKPQGMVSQLCRASLLRRPLTVFVSMDTLRDYIFVDDAAEMLRVMLDDLDADEAATVHVRLVASGSPTTLAALIETTRRVLRRAPRIVYVDSPVTSLQARDLRLSPIRPVRLRRPLTPLSHGVRMTFNDVLRKYQIGELAAAERLIERRAS